MIFLKKIFAAAAAILCIGIQCGCGVYTDENGIQPATSVEETTAATVQTPVLTAVEGTYVYDNAAVLSTEAVANCNAYTAALYMEKLINAAVVTTNDLGGKTPYEYAQEAYNELYEGKGSGFLLLINNDTNNDYIFRTGSCGVYVTDEAEKQEFYWATKEIVSGDYEGAVTRLMKLAENCPSHIFDNAGVFTSEKGAEIDSALAACNAEISVLVTSNSTGTANQELLQSYFDRHYTGTNGTMLLIDTVSKTVTAVSDGEIPQKLSTAVSKANTLAAKGEYEAAIKAITDAMGGTEA